MAKFSDIRDDVMKRLKVDGRTREGRALKAAARRAMADINTFVIDGRLETQAAANRTAVYVAFAPVPVDVPE